MANQEHLELSDYIKNTHRLLRSVSKEVGFEKAWEEHCNDKNRLEKYAYSMKTLAVEHWDKGNNSELNSRIEWIYNACIDYYFKEGYLKQRYKEEEIIHKLSYECDTLLSNKDFDGTLLKLLDVGSCYNPFKKFNGFEVVAIDIAPASSDVLYCDFLNLQVTDFDQNDGEITFRPCSLDVVVFSLLLEYFPCPKQRLQCCTNAYKVLKPEGILMIVTPDSNHVGKNAKIMKSWKYILARLGFSRIKYEKLKHVHCMAFRKSILPEISQRWAKSQEPSKFYKEMFVPQDFTKEIETVQADKSSVAENLHYMSYLPKI